MYIYIYIYIYIYLFIYLYIYIYIYIYNAHDLSLCQWQNIFACCLSVNNYWSVFYNVLRELVDKCVPVRVRKDRYCSSRVHLPRAVRQLVQRKRKAWKRWRVQPSVENKAAFNAASRRCRSAEQEDQLLQAGPHNFFAYASKQLHPLSTVISLTSASGTVTDPASICDILSREFSKNFNSSKVDAVVSSGCSAECSETMKFVPNLSLINVDISTVRIVLSQLRDSAADPDGLLSVFFKRLAYWLAAPLTIIYQQSLLIYDG